MNQGESTGSGANSQRYHMQGTSLQEHIFGNFVTKDAGTAVAHLQSGRKKGAGIIQNKLPVDVVGGWCQSRSIKLGVLIPFKSYEPPAMWQRQFYHE